LLMALISLMMMLRTQIELDCLALIMTQRFGCK
jgi:hypothetical protein